MMAGRRERVLGPVHPNVGVEEQYRRRMVKLIDEMHRSLAYWLKAAYRANQPEIAVDELPAEILKRAMSRLARQWQGHFDSLAEELAAHFAKDAAARSDFALKAMLKKHGVAVEFRMTAAQRDILKATVEQNVELIKSIPAQYLTQVQGSVMRSVQEGRDLKSLADDLQRHYGVTKRRAQFIARDQNNKATAAFNRARQTELGITEAVWVHSGAGKHPRPTHQKAGRDKVRYEVAKGWWDPALKKFIWPGTEPNCRCTSRSIIPGFL